MGAFVTAGFVSGFVVFGLDHIHEIFGCVTFPAGPVTSWRWD